MSKTFCERGDPEKAIAGLDLATAQDRKLLGVALKKRWPISEELRARAVEALQATLEVATSARELAAVASLLRSLTAMEGQNQADDHKVEEYARLDAGKASGNVRIEVVDVVARPPADPLDEHPKVGEVRGD